MCVIPSTFRNHINNYLSLGQYKLTTIKLVWLMLQSFLLNCQLKKIVQFLLKLLFFVTSFSIHFLVETENKIIIIHIQNMKCKDSIEHAFETSKFLFAVKGITYPPNKSNNSRNLLSYYTTYISIVCSLYPQNELAYKK